MKKNKFIYIILVFLFFNENAFSQKKHKPKAMNKSIALTINASNSNIVPKKTEAYILFHRDDKYEKCWSNAGGIYFTISKNNWSLKLENYLSKFCLLQKSGFGYWYCNPKDYGATTSLYAERLLRLNGINAALSIGRTIKIKKFELSPYLGISTLYIISKFHDITVTLDNGVKVNRDIDHMNIKIDHKVNYSPEIGFSLSYSISKRISLIQNLNYNIWLLKEQILSEFSQTYLSQINLKFGVMYKFH